MSSVLEKKIVNKKVKAKIIGKMLDELYPNPQIPLDHKDPYTLLIAVLLSAQCTDKRVNQVTPQLFEMADTPGQMMLHSTHEIAEIIKSCGLVNSKAPAIKKLSQILVEQYQGEVPQNMVDLEKLPGVGHKTASVVMVQAFNKLAFPVDTHIHRLATRWGLTSGRNVKETERDLKYLFPEKDWAKTHLQMIFYGREHCSARGCDGSKCLICRTCSRAQRH